MVGCPDITWIRNAWVRRYGDRAVISCNFTSETFYVTCDDNRWPIDFVNCSQGMGTTSLLSNVVSVGAPFGLSTVTRVAPLAFIKCSKIGRPLAFIKYTQGRGAIGFCHLHCPVTIDFLESLQFRQNPQPCPFVRLSVCFSVCYFRDGMSYFGKK